MRHARQRRINRRLRGLLVAAVVLLAAAAVAGAVALVQRSHARRSATTAEAQRLGAQALTVTPPDQSFLYARESYNLDPSPATRGYLFAAEERSPAALAVVQPLAARIRAMLASPDRSRQLVLSNTGKAAVIDVANPEDGASLCADWRRCLGRKRRRSVPGSEDKCAGVTGHRLGTLQRRQAPPGECVLDLK